MVDDRNVPVVLSAVRTAIGSFMGSLSPLPATELGGAAIREAVSRAGVKPETVDEVIMGNVVTAGEGQAPARQAAIKGGLPETVGALTVNKVCGSGLKAVMLAASAIRAGDGEIFVAGGMESMSHVPYYLAGARAGFRMGHQQIVDGMIQDGLWCAFSDKHMGSCAEHIARRFDVSRADQDNYALASHRKAIAAQDAGKLAAEIVTVHVAQRKGEALAFSVDESPRRDTTLEKLASLRPAFEKSGSVTAGNAPGLNDGAAALVVTSLAAAKRLERQPLAFIAGYAQGAVVPIDVFYAPVVAVQNLMRRHGWAIGDFDLVEANEAFAAQALVDGRELGWDWSRVNVNGGAIALGHPLGASGARVLVTLVHAMRDRGAQRGLATLCLGGGEAVALAVERPGA
ncbi:MAG: acetyl-CoA C-acetyltransferase [Candidatus Schekmanbacteria bacterium]|nr:acetyl-CoA C-acetyltransferase [Candidatus Schekmanbacteria bacterium]